MQASELLQLLAVGLTVGSVYALVALGFTMIYNATGIINLAQGEFLTLGGLVFYTLYVPAHVPLPLALLGAVAAVTVVGLLTERLAIRPLLGSSPVTLIIVTVGVSVTLRGAAKLIWGPASLAVPDFSGDTALNLGGVAVRAQYLWVIGLTAAAVAAVNLFYDRTLVGKAMRACAVNPEAARLIGISVERMVQLSFALSAALAALAGAVLSPVTFASFDGGVMLGIKGFCGAIIGGLGNGVGALLGGLLLGVAESLGVALLPQGASGYQNVFAFVILILALLLRPEGLLGRRREGLA
jgi:branched-chain amino acid transport system permease protein